MHYPTHTLTPYSTTVLISKKRENLGNLQKQNESVTNVNIGDIRKLFFIGVSQWFGLWGALTYLLTFLEFL